MGVIIENIRRRKTVVTNFIENNLDSYQNRYYYKTTTVTPDGWEEVTDEDHEYAGNYRKVLDMEIPSEDFISLAHVSPRTDASFWCEPNEDDGGYVVLYSEQIPETELELRFLIIPHSVGDYRSEVSLSDRLAALEEAFPLPPEPVFLMFHPEMGLPETEESLGKSFVVGRLTEGMTLRFDISEFDTSDGGYPPNVIYLDYVPATIDIVDWNIIDNTGSYGYDPETEQYWYVRNSEDDVGTPHPPIEGTVYEFPVDMSMKCILLDYQETGKDYHNAVYLIGDTEESDPETPTD